VSVLAFEVWGSVGWPITQVRRGGRAYHYLHVTNLRKHHVVNVHTDILVYATHTYTEHTIYLGPKGCQIAVWGSWPSRIP